MIEELDMVALTRDFDSHGLKRGDIGAVVHKYSKEGFEVEFVAAEGKTVAVLTLQRPIYDLCEEEKFCMPGRYRMLPMHDLHVSKAIPTLSAQFQCEALDSIPAGNHFHLKDTIVTSSA